MPSNLTNLTVATVSLRITVASWHDRGSCQSARAHARPTQKKLSLVQRHALRAHPKLGRVPRRHFSTPVAERRGSISIRPRAATLEKSRQNDEQKLVRTITGPRQGQTKRKEQQLHNHEHAAVALEDHDQRGHAAQPHRAAQRLQQVQQRERAAAGAQRLLKLPPRPAATSACTC